MLQASIALNLTDILETDPTLYNVFLVQQTCVRPIIWLNCRCVTARTTVCECSPIGSYYGRERSLPAFHGLPHFLYGILLSDITLSLKLLVQSWKLGLNECIYCWLPYAAIFVCRNIRDRSIGSLQWIPSIIGCPLWAITLFTNSLGFFSQCH